MYECLHCVQSDGHTPHDVTHPQTFAIKLLSFPSDLGAKQRFLDEGLLLEKLQHPHIVSIEERSHDSETQHPYIVMEHCAGGDLRTLIDRLKVSQCVTSR